VGSGHCRAASLIDAAFSESYSYDNLNQLIGFTRGSHTRSWDYDAQGNWQSVTTNGNTQTRTHNAQNEITGLSGAVTPTYDANGNLTRDETGRQFVYDAWNRLVAVKDASGNTLKSYAYDGLHRRISETASGTTTDLYYSDAWQVLEERVCSDSPFPLGDGLGMSAAVPRCPLLPSPFTLSSSPLPVGEGSGVRAQYVWSPVYVDALVLRDRDTTGDGTLDERLWVVQDANYNVTALFDNSGNVVERYVYDPFGQVTILDAGWNTLSTSAFAWNYLHQGGRFDATSGLYHFRFRDYSPTLGRWTSLDPLRYAAGDVNLYRYVGNTPTLFTDPSGLDKFWLIDGNLLGPLYLINPFGENVWSDAWSLLFPPRSSDYLGWPVHQNFDPDQTNRPSGLKAGDIIDRDTRDWHNQAVQGLKSTLAEAGILAGMVAGGVPAGRGLEVILKDDKLFLRWLKHKHPVDKPLSACDATSVWNKLKSLGKKPRLDAGHPGTKWTGPHINVDGNIHIPVDPGFTPP
jgi:RHS repeat-associated protein